MLLAVLAVLAYGKSVPAEVIPYVVEASARSGNLAFATSLLEQELRRTPNNDVLWNDLGNVLAMRGDGRSAVMAYERAVMINPGNQEAAVNLLRARQTAKKTGR